MIKNGARERGRIDCVGDLERLEQLWFLIGKKKSSKKRPKFNQGPPSDPEVIARVHTSGARVPGRRPILKEIDESIKTKPEQIV